MCAPKPKAAQPPAPAPVRNADELIADSLTGLRLNGIPDPPLSPVSTRNDREAFLVATEQPRELLRALITAEVPPAEVGAELFGKDHTQETSVIANALAVELADAIDRGDEEGAKRALFAAFRFADVVARNSVADWMTACGIADALCQGIRSVAPQLTTKLASVMRQAVEDLNAKAPDANTAILNTSNRIKNWSGAATQNSAPISVEQAVMECLSDTAGRQPSTPMVLEALKAKSQNGMLPAAFRANQVRLASDMVIAFLDGARSGSTVSYVLPDAKAEPLAALYVASLRPSIEAAPKLSAIREECLRLIMITVRIIAAGTPDNLSGFGDEARSPVNGMLFEYRKTKDGFDLTRPRQSR